MSELKDQIIRLIQCRAKHDAAELAGQFARAAQGQREEIFAAMEFEKWLAQACALSLEKD